MQTQVPAPALVAIKYTADASPIQVSLPPALAAIAAGRDHILTEEFAKAANRASQTIRKNYCQKGECFGIRPLKFGNRLLWPVSQIAALLNGDMPSKAA
jgi:hypothetical protein